MQKGGGGGHRHQKAGNEYPVENREDWSMPLMSSKKLVMVE